MSEFQPFSAALDLSSTEDSMDFYPDQNDRPSADDGIDLDLDLATDTPQSIRDDDMVDDSDDGMEQTAQLHAVPGLDEQMMDEIGGGEQLLHGATVNAFREQDVDIDDIGYDDPDEVHLNAPIVEDLTQSAQNHVHTAPQSIMQQASQSYNPIAVQTHNQAEPETLGAARSTQELLGQYPAHEDVADPTSLPFSVAPQSTTRRTSDRGISMAPLPEERHISYIEIPARSDRTPALPAEPSNKSIDVSASINDVGYDYHDVISSHTNDCLQQNSAESHPCREELSAPNEGERDKDSIISTNMSYNPRQEVDDNQAANPFPHKPRVHATIVTYQESDMFLFPPAAEEQDDDQTYFLTSESLAAEPIVILLRECRDVLEGSISQLEELQIDIDDLGLRIFESDVDAGSTTLIDILSLYLELYFNDGSENPPPMRMTLSTNVRFSRRLEYLTRSVAEGKGISQLDDEDLSPESEFLEESQDHETTKAAGAPSTDSTPRDANEITTNESHDHRGLSAEGQAPHLPSEEPPDLGDASNRGVVSVDAKKMTESSLGGAAASTDRKPFVDREGAPNADPIITQPIHELQEEQSSVNHFDDEDGREATREVQLKEYDHVGDDPYHNETGRSSNGWSAIQANDAGTVGTDARTPPETTASDSGLSSTVRSVTHPPSNEDVITYESDEQDDDTGEVSSEDLGQRLYADVENSASEPFPTLPSQGALSYDLNHVNQVASSTLATEDLDADSLVQNETKLQRIDPYRAGGASEPHNKDVGGRTHRTCHSNGSSGSTAHKLDQSPTNLDDVNSDPGSSNPVQHSAKLADGDEITFDEDEAEEGTETETLVLASTGTAFEQASNFSPRSLKRRLATDNDSPLLVTDSKRARSG
ncbi:MAG: hypothetical protein Q9207_002121 [Kuettlingeria erythrocarpa]